MYPRYLLVQSGGFNRDPSIFFLSASVAYNSMHSSNKSCLGSKKLKRYDNSFTCSIIFATPYILQALQMLRFSL